MSNSLPSSMSHAQSSQKRSLDTSPSDSESSKRLHLMISHDPLSERAHRTRDLVIVDQLREMYELDLEAENAPLSEEDYAAIFCAVAYMECTTHSDWIRYKKDAAERLSVFHKAVAVAGEPFVDALKEASRERSFKLIRNAAFLRERFPVKPVEDEIAWREVVRKAWKTPYASDRHRLLVNIITRMKKGEWVVGPSDFNNTVMIVQSSGTGKSRMVDEAARLVFTLPFNLRSDKDFTGYPPPDPEVRDYMCRKWSKDMKCAEYHAFLMCLCRSAAAEVQSLFHGPRMRHADFASIWRDHLAQKNVRAKLYQAVVAQALEAATSELDGVAHPLEAVGSLLDKTYSEMDNLRQTIASKVDDLGGIVDILIYFDEAHELTKAVDYSGNSLYDVLLLVINCYRDYPIFTLFLSTVPLVVAFTPPPLRWSNSARASKSGEPQAPFTETPFDCAENILVVDHAHDREEIAQLHFMARFGRPLFWATLEHIPATNHKSIQTFLDTLRSTLINESDHLISPSECDKLGHLAVADVRLNLQYEPNLKKIQVLDVQEKLVASHMRIVYSFPAHRRYFDSGYPSEPVLAEAAAQQLHHWRETQPSILLDIIHQQMKSGLLDRRERGELVARILILEAYDRAVIEAFTKSQSSSQSPSSSSNADQQQVPLFSLGCRLIGWIEQIFVHDLAQEILDSKPTNCNRGEQTFREVFKDAWIRITHFARAADDDHIFNTHTMFAAFVRGMAFICANGALVNLVIPVLMRDVKIGASVMSAVFIQVGRRAKRGSYVIDAEKHFNFFHPEPNLPKDDRPYVTLIMDLGVQDSLPNRTRLPNDMVKTSRRRTSATTTTSKSSPVRPRRGDKQSHPRYEIYISGCSKNHYNLILPTQDSRANSKYKEILSMSEFLAEHPREDTIAQVMQFKPVFVIGQGRNSGSYSWIKSDVLNPMGLRDREGEEDEDEDGEEEERCVVGRGWEGEGEEGEESEGGDVGIDED